ncbi:MAG: DUF349 domain-containing protein [Marinospirillum sp.]|uniref:DUF349 domain-containing protein n=1 Tax=Marinospirillum sp. TaxID=2183934 RepID=UPI0019FF183C|nr:DUF349 domain-containing protein [Marinospirillum sp.]MBE0507125.1 DUF349 domain-containing protein [Marinospirillum sp.]
MNSLFIRIAPFFFKPTLEHRNPDVRLLALERLQLENAEHQNAFLEWLRQEQNVSLLESALKLFPHTSTLIQLLNDQQESDSALAKTLCRHLAILLASEHQYTTAERQNLVSLIHHTPLQLELIRTAEPIELRLNLLQQLQADEEHWLDIALGNTLAKVRLQAAETLSSETTLEKLLRNAQGDKRVQRLARDRLNAYRAAAQAEADALEQRHKLLEQLQRLVDGRDEKLFAARLEHLTKQWQSLDLAKAEELQQRFDQLYQRAEAFIQQLQAAEAERLAVIAQQLAAEENRQQLQQQLDDLIQQLQAETPLTVTSDHLQSLHDQWQQTLQQHPAKSQQQQSFQQRFTQANTLLQAVAQWQQLQPTLEQLLQSVSEENTQLDALQELLQPLNWPDELTPPATLVRAQEILSSARELQIQQRKAQQVAAAAPAINTQMLDKQLQQLEQLLNAGQSRDALKLHQQLQAAADKLPGNHILTTRYRSLSAQLAELKDWQGFAAAPKREQLCEQMEILAADERMEAQVKADKIQALQQEWQALGSAAANKPLWDRFKQAADLAYEPCKAWFASQSKAREYNQQQRAIICNELEQLTAAGTHRDMTETALDELLSKIHDEWRRFNPVNRAEGKRLADRFQLALNPIKEQLQLLRQSHAEQKRALIDAARNLLESDNLQEATEISKQLQQDWRTAGTAPGSLEHQLWKEFRSLCDALFELRDQQRKTRQQERQQRFEVASEQLQQAQAAIQTKDLNTAVKLHRAAAGLRNVPRKEQEIWQQQLDQLAAEISQLQQQQQRQGSAHLLQEKIQQLPAEGEPSDNNFARRLLVQLDLLTGQPLPEEDQQLKLELQIERMNTGLGVVDEANMQGEILQLLDQWQQIGGSKQGVNGQRLMDSIRYYIGE